MSGKNYLLDTNIVIGLFANDLTIVQKIAAQASDIFVPSIVLGELFYGVEQSTKRDENRKKIDAFAQASSILDCDLETARFYGKVKSQLKIKGTPIPENDIWIGALALQHSLILVTRDNHFDFIKELMVESW